VFDDLELRIAKLALGPDDILVLRPGRILTSVAEVEIAARIGQRFGLTGRVMVLGPDTELSVVAKSDVASETPPLEPRRAATEPAVTSPAGAPAKPRASSGRA
jgi:hypothetical protein